MAEWTSTRDPNSGEQRAIDLDPEVSDCLSVAFGPEARGATMRPIRRPHAIE
jgi:hypothetical protein